MPGSLKASEHHGSMDSPSKAWKNDTIKKWLTERGIKYNKSDKKAKLLKRAAAAPPYVDRTVGLSSRDWLVSKGYSTQYETQDGEVSGPMYTSSNPYGYNAWTKRRQLLEGLEIKTPFLVPEESGKAMKFDKFLEANGWSEGTDEPVGNKGGYLIEEVAQALAKNRRPFPKMMTEAISWAIAQQGLSACTVGTVLVVPYLGATAVQLHPSADDTDAEADKVLHGRQLPDTIDSEFLLNAPHFGANAEQVAAELSECTADYAVVLIQQIDYNGSAGDDVKHMNSVVVHMRTRRAFYFEPHMTDDSYSAPSNNMEIAYNEIQSSVGEFLKEAIGATMQHSPSKGSCPVESSAGFSGLQGNDALCASWSVYAAAVYVLNPTIPTETLTQTISFADVYRMLYVIFTAVPMTYSIGRNSRGKEFMHKWHKRFAPLVEEGFVNREARRQIVKHMQKHPAYLDSFTA